MVESRRVPGKGRIRVSPKKLSGRVSKNGRISVTTEKWKNPGEYQKKVESVSSTEKLSRRVPKNGRISVSTEKW